MEDSQPVQAGDEFVVIFRAKPPAAGTTESHFRKLIKTLGRYHFLEVLSYQRRKASCDAPDARIQTD